MDYSQYEREVKTHLTEKRFYHSQCVAEEAARLAQRYGADVEKARLAGILHDIMKDTPPEEQLKILTDSGIILTNTQRRNRTLWHAGRRTSGKDWGLQTRKSSRRWNVTPAERAI